MFVGGLIYSLYHHIRLLIIEKKTTFYRRSLFANFLSAIAIAGFLTAFLFSIGVNIDLFSGSAASASTANAACYVFVGILIFSKVFLTPRQRYSLSERS